MSKLLLIGAICALAACAEKPGAHKAPADKQQVVRIDTAPVIYQPKTSITDEQLVALVKRQAINLNTLISYANTRRVYCAIEAEGQGTEPTVRCTKILSSAKEGD